MTVECHTSKKGHHQQQTLEMLKDRSFSKTDSQTLEEKTGFTCLLFNNGRRMPHHKNGHQQRTFDMYQEREVHFSKTESHRNCTQAAPLEKRVSSSDKS